jgi:tetratricopeptide (TPR) repeat protein
LPQAIELLEQVRDGAVKKLGAGHPDTLRTLNNLATLYQATGKLPQAIELLQQVRDAMVKKLGADHPDTLRILNNLALAYQSAGKLPQAIELLQQVRDRSVKKLGPEHPQTIVAWHNLGWAYQIAGKSEQALPLLEQAAKGMQKGKFQYHHAAGIVAHVIACHEELKQFARAESWRRKWLAVVKERAGAESPAYAGELAALGLNLLKQNQWTNAELVLRQCLRLREKLARGAKPAVLPWLIANTRSMLGEALAGQKQFADAKSLLLAGYQAMKERQATIPQQVRQLRLGEALERVVKLYDAWEKKDEAAKWRKERDSR